MTCGFSQVHFPVAPYGGVQVKDLAPLSPPVEEAKKFKILVVTVFVLAVKFNV